MGQAKVQKYAWRADNVRRALFPMARASTQGWIRENIGEPEFGWDCDTVFDGFFTPLNSYIASDPFPFCGMLSAGLIDAAGRDWESMSPVIAACERTGIASRAFEDLSLGYRYEDPREGLANVYGGVVNGSITSTLLGQMYNIFLHKNPLNLDDGVRLKMFHYCSRETVRMRYVSGMQIGWMRDEKYVPQMADAINYAMHGPMGSANKLSIRLTAMACGMHYEELGMLEKLMDKLSTLCAIRDSLMDVSNPSPRKLAEDFRIGKVTPLTVLASQDRRLPIKSIPRLQSGFSLHKILENACEKVDALARTWADQIRADAESSELSGSEMFQLFSEQLITDISRLTAWTK